MVSATGFSRYFYLYPHGSFTGWFVASNLKLNNKTCTSHLKCFTDIGLLKKAIIGKSHVFSINKSHFWNELNRLFDNETTLLDNIKSDIYEFFKKYCTKIILFGSYAESLENEDSDLDICFIFRKEHKDKVEQLCDSYQETFYEKYLCHLSPYLTDEKNFKNSKLTLVKEIKSNGVVINGEN